MKQKYYYQGGIQMGIMHLANRIFKLKLNNSWNTKKTPYKVSFFRKTFVSR